ncbi:MAG: alpha/beta hydrolase [Lachnospiraceae bacterium]|nr:alpha/beta hydrolase [Lachnospiraceae bacterium]
MKETRYTHISGTDGVELSVLRLEPDDASAIKGIVQIAHGMNEYKERYCHFMEFLVNAGYIAIIHDHRGHGRAITHRKYLGHMFEGGYEALIEDTHEITLEVKKYASETLGLKDLPFILLGHSMGSLVVRCYIRKYDSEVNKLLVVGCPSKQAGMAPGLLLIKIIKLFRGEGYKDIFVGHLVMGRFEKRFKKEPIKHSWVNSDPEEMAKYNSDPYCMFLFTLNGFENLVRLSMLTYKNGGYAMKNPDLPIIFLSGADDPCGVSEKKVRSAAELLKKQGYKNVDVKMYEGMRHEVLQETHKDIVYSDVLSFIEEKK